MRTAVTVGLVLVVGVVGCKREIDHEMGEKLIRENLTGRGLKVQSVECPSGHAVKKGDKFSCTVQTDHQKLTINLEQADDEGNVQWQLEGHELHEKAFGDQLESKVGGGIDIVCGDQVTIVQVGDTIRCDTKHPDGTIDIKVKNDNGDVEWKLTPKS